MHSASRFVLETNGKEPLSLVAQLCLEECACLATLLETRGARFSLSRSLIVWSFELSSPHESANTTEIALPGGFPLGRLALSWKALEHFFGGERPKRPCGIVLALF